MPVPYAVKPKLKEMRSEVPPEALRLVNGVWRQRQVFHSLAEPRKVALRNRPRGVLKTKRE
jgi:hypothetical protein